MNAAGPAEQPAHQATLAARALESADLAEEHRAIAEQFQAGDDDRYVLTTVLIGALSPLPRPVLDEVGDALAAELIRYVEPVATAARAVVDGMRTGRISFTRAHNLHVAVERHRAFIARTSDWGDGPEGTDALLTPPPPRADDNQS